MKKRMLTPVLILTAAASYSALTATSDNFSTSTGTLPDWTSVGAVTTLIKHDAISSGDYDDGDLTQKLSYTAGMTLTGDGVKDDGGMQIDTQDAIPGNEAAGLTIGGFMEEGEIITFTGSAYNDNTSYYRYNAQLWNLTDGTLLAESGDVIVQPGGNINYVPVDFNIVYTALASDEGDTLQIRFREGADNIVRDIFVDNVSLTSVPPPPGKLIGVNFDGDSGTLAENTAQWDYTARTAYDANTAAENTLAFNGKSTGTDYIIRDKGTGHSTALFFKTINTSSSDFGIYLLNMNFTFDGTNSVVAVRINWSFDILGYNQNGSLIPTGWTVKLNTGNNTPGVSLADSSVSTLAQTFDFAADTTGETSTDGTWTTVSGSATIPPGAAGTNGVIQISTDNGGYTSAGGVFLDNIMVSVTNVPPVLRLIMLSD